MNSDQCLSFSSVVKLEILSTLPRMNCCKKAFLLGLLYNSAPVDKSRFATSFGLRESAETAEDLLGAVAEATVKEGYYVGRKKYFLEYSSKAFSSFRAKISHGQSIREAAKFRCAECESAFIGGLMVSSSTVNDPRKGYHLEISFSKENSELSEPVSSLLSECGFEMKRTVRANKSALYIKSNTAIADILSYVGAMKASFDVTNTYIERDIRNNENRATNFVAENISKSVSANQRHLAAINKLIENNMLDKLPRELYETAMLRIENDDMSLSELALIHEPPITKSGLNHRLAKICREADEISKES
ncbi:MAG: DNA-binding protein WhiA [Ruminococcaceae bacterium]|nr:DNA-binding protein WhiA [Oscillospiraceae bacterium]